MSSAAAGSKSKLKLRTRRVLLLLLLLLLLPASAVAFLSCNAQRTPRRLSVSIKSFSRLLSALGFLLWALGFGLSAFCPVFLLRAVGGVFARLFCLLLFFGGFLDEIWEADGKVTSLDQTGGYPSIVPAASYHVPGLSPHFTYLHFVLTIICLCQIYWFTDLLIYCAGGEGKVRARRGEGKASRGEGQDKRPVKNSNAKDSHFTLDWPNMTKIYWYNGIQESSRNKTINRVS